MVCQVDNVAPGVDLALMITQEVDRRDHLTALVLRGCTCMDGVLSRKFFGAAEWSAATDEQGSDVCVYVTSCQSGAGAKLKAP